MTEANKEAIELLKATKVLALVFETYRKDTPKAVTQSIRETFYNINQALDCLRKQPESLQAEIGGWAESIFTQATNASICKHLRREVKELIKSYQPEEAADCMFLLLHFAYKNGFDLFEQVRKKLTTNKNRKWGQPDKDGVVEHLRKQPEAGNETADFLKEFGQWIKKLKSRKPVELEVVIEETGQWLKRCYNLIEWLQAENKDYARRLLSHKKGEGVKATCDIHGDWWYVDDEPIVCPKCRPKQALQAEKGGE